VRTQVEVLSPPELRTDLKTGVERLVALYRKK
jgi:hypothetical protein